MDRVIYPMPALTKQQREELIQLAKDVQRPDGKGNKTLLGRIALAALTAVADQNGGWISCNERMPENQNGKYSDPVIALADSGQVFTLSCMGNYWQRTRAFIDSGATKVTHWQPLNLPHQKVNT